MVYWIEHNNKHNTVRNWASNVKRLPMIYDNELLQKYYVNCGNFGRTQLQAPFVRLVLCVCFRTIFTSISVCRCQSTSIALAMPFSLQVRTTLCFVLLNENHKSIIISKALVCTETALHWCQRYSSMDAKWHIQSRNETESKYRTTI